jgi:F-box protein 21
VINAVFFVVLLTLNSADDKSVRYVAEENITVLSDAPTQNLLDLAGRYFKRWDDEEKVFVSNIRDEYPHD